MCATREMKRLLILRFLLGQVSSVIAPDFGNIFAFSLEVSIGLDAPKKHIGQRRIRPRISLVKVRIFNVPRNPVQAEYIIPAVHAWLKAKRKECPRMCLLAANVLERR